MPLGSDLQAAIPLPDKDSADHENRARWTGCDWSAGAQVVAQGDEWYCEFDSKTYPAMVRRYVMQARFCDESGEATLSVFDDQARPHAQTLNPIHAGALLRRVGRGHAVRV